MMDTGLKIIAAANAISLCFGSILLFSGISSYPQLTGFGIGMNAVLVIWALVDLSRDRRSMEHLSQERSDG